MEGGIRALRVSHVAYPGRQFDTPSGKVELMSERAESLGLPALPVHADLPASPFPLTLRQGRTLTHFHGFYDHGRALPTLAKADPEPALWVAPADAAARAVADGDAIRIHNERGAMTARAHVTPRVPAGTVWMRDGWDGLNRLTSGDAVLPDRAVDAFGFSGGQATFDAKVEIEPIRGT
jgi:anaerobic selenocysteine-containing dehydrogenase